MSDFLERLKIEDQELAEKAAKLKNFINDKEGPYSKLDDVNKYLLRKQLHIMMQYLTVLMLRIDLIEGKGEKTENLFEGYDFAMIPHLDYDTDEMFDIKESARNLINDINIYGQDRERVSIASTHVEIASMFGVKSLFT